MLKNYFKIAWRNLHKNKGFSFVNVLGLTIGITCCMLIFLWVKDELTYDRFHANYSNIYKVMANRNFNNQVFTDENMVLPLAKSLEASSTQVKNAVVITHRQQSVFANGETKLKQSGYTVSEHFFDVFTWKFIKGNKSVLNDPSAILLTQSAAKALFGDTDPINKILKIDNDRNARVAGILADPPGNSTLQFDYIRPFNYSDESVKNSMNEWTNSSWLVFVQTIPGADVALLEKNINAIKKQHDKSDEMSQYFPFPLKKLRLYSDFKEGKNIGGMIEYVRLFIVIAVFILLIACVNFMNLSTARSEKRAKEIGIRKTLGSVRAQLILQFFSESFLLSLIAFVLSIVAVIALLPSFNLLVNKQLSLPFGESFFWLVSIAILLFTGLVAGSYPALYLSSFSPIKVLKGSFVAGKKALLPRHILVVAQFVFSILLISATIIIYQQLNHIKNRDVGYNPNNLIMIPSTADVSSNYTALRQELLQTGKIKAVTRTLSPITEIWWRDLAPDYKGKPANTQIIVASITTDIDFARTMGVKMLAGNDFSGLPVDSASMVINKAAVEAMDLKNPVGMQLRKNGRDYTVIGVTDNIVMETPFKPVDPLIMYYSPSSANVVSLRLHDGVHPQEGLAAIEKVFKKYNPAYPFEYQFADQEFNKKFIAEELISKITNIFALLAIFICCMGVAGLASFTIEKRIREIGIRKVLGASIQNLLLLISREFLRLITIAFIIAVPLTWWLMTGWLEKYSFKVAISLWLFAGVGIFVLLLTITVVSLNTLKAVMANPIKSLRTE